MNKMLLFLALSFSSFCICMEQEQVSALDESTISTLVTNILSAAAKINEPSDKELIRKIIAARFSAIETFAGVLAQLRYAESTQYTFQHDYWSEAFVKRVTDLETLDNQASDDVKEFFKTFDKLCSQDASYSYQKIAPLLYSYYGNAKAWDTYFKSAILYNKATQYLDNRINKSFLSLKDLKQAKKRPFLSDLKRIIEALKGTTIEAFKSFEEFSNERLLLFAQNHKVLEKSYSLIKDHMAVLENNRHTFTQVEAKLKPSKATTEEDLVYYKELYQLNNDHRKLQLEADDILSHEQNFKSLLEQMKLYSSSIFSSDKIRSISKIAYAALKPNSLSELQDETKLHEYIFTHRDNLCSTFKNHLTIAINFHYLNYVYHAIEKALPTLLIHEVERTLKSTLEKLQAVCLEKESPEKQELLEILKKEVRKLKSIRDELYTTLWNLVQHLCQREWNSIREAGKACIADLATTQVCLNCYTLVEESLLGYNNTYQNHPEIIKTFRSAFTDQSNIVIILNKHIIPYVIEVYKDLFKSSCLFHPLEPSEEKMKDIIQIVTKTIKEKGTSLLRKPSTPLQNPAILSTTQVQEASITIPIITQNNEFEGLKLEEEKQQEITISTPLKFHAISYEEHQRLKELTRKLFIPTISKIKETDDTIVLRAWRGYSSDENTTMTLFKVRSTGVRPLECIIIVNPKILKKAKDRIDSNWDRYHTFSFAIEHDYLSSCALIVHPSDNLAQQLKLHIDKDSYALCIKTRVGRTDGYIVYLVKNSSRICSHRFFHEL